MTPETLSELAPPSWAHEGLCQETPEPFLASLDVGADGLDDGTADSPVPLDLEEHEGVIRAMSDAVDVCKRCPVLDECREYALSNGEPFGVWGALLPAERAEIEGLAKRAARRAKRSQS